VLRAHRLFIISDVIQENLERQEGPIDIFLLEILPPPGRAFTEESVCQTFGSQALFYYYAGKSNYLLGAFTDIVDVTL